MDRESRKAVADMEARHERMLALMSVKSQPIMAATSGQPQGGTPDGERRRV